MKNMVYENRQFGGKHIDLCMITIDEKWLPNDSLAQHLITVIQSLFFGNSLYGFCEFNLEFVL